MLHPQLGTPGLPKPMTGSNVLFFWDGMKHDVHNFVAECDVCQHNKGKIVKSPSTRQPLLFHLLFGGISLWILLHTYLNQAINQSSWW
jgi:hypothetical protein